MIKKYNTKPCVIEAVQWNGFNADEIFAFCGRDASFISTDKEVLLTIYTLEGEMRASVGDFIIKGLRGEFYPCKENVFNKKYEEVK